jgi:hypothetical protein
VKAASEASAGSAGSKRRRRTSEVIVTRGTATGLKSLHSCGTVCGEGRWRGRVQGDPLSPYHATPPYLPTLTLTLTLALALALTLTLMLQPLTSLTMSPSRCSTASE